MINTENISVGQSIKNYKELCKLLNEKDKGGKSKILHIRDLERYILFSRNGNKFIIERIYEEPIPKIDGRGKSEGSRNNYNGKYVEFIDPLLLQYLQKEQTKLKDSCKIYTTNNKIAEKAGIVNCNYRTAYNNQSKFYNTVKKEFGIKTNTYCMKDTLDMTKTKIREIVKSSLDRLQNAEQLVYEPCYFVYIPYLSRIPTEDELKAINIAELETLEEMGIEHKQKIDNSEKLSKEFNEKVLVKVQKQFDYIISIYKGYTIYLCVDIELKSDIEIRDSMKQLNVLVIKSLRERPHKMQEKAQTDVCSKNWFGLRNPSWKPWNYDRLSKKYIEHCYSFINILCDIEANNIVNKIKSCKNSKMQYGLTTQQKDKLNDKIAMKLIDQLGFDDNNNKEEVDKLFDNIKLPY